MGFTTSGNIRKNGLLRRKRKPVFHALKEEINAFSTRDLEAY